ncbi:DegT/DnrJ/EryC1/StrS family aminotransferase [bacterium]|nr:MAG: DegT/DnrJ/EryC1/StrS family aminotransferase [bacterium]
MSWKVPFIDYPAHYQKMEAELTNLIKDVLFTRADLILRDDLRQFEHNIASFIGVKYAVGVGNCTEAIYLSLKAARIQPGDEIITVGHTFVATVSSIVHCGAIPILVDIAEDFNLDVAKIEKAITTKTKAIIPVHLNGRLCNMKKITEIASKYRLLIIEDAAQALGGKFDGELAGSFGLSGCFSFFPAKILGAAGDGGLVCTNNKDFADKVYLLRDHGRLNKTDIAFYGFNSRLDNLQAAILNAKLKYLPEWITRRRQVAKLYQDGLEGLKEITLPPKPDLDNKYFDVFQNYVIRHKKRGLLVDYLKKAGIETLISWPKPMHYQNALNLNHFRLPLTEQISNEVISLPMNTEISDNQVRYVVDTIHKFFREH